jgi:translation initiation factor eIF-2B subunit delta
VHDDPSKRRRYEKGAVVARTEAAKQIPLFSHLPQYERETSLSLKVGFLTSDIPPPILRLGLQYTNGDITGSNARCVALLSALRAVIASHPTPANKTLRDDLLHRLKPWLRFLSDCRPLSVSMGNAIRWLKQKIGKLSPTLDEAEARRQLLQEIDGFVRGRILLADELIVKEAVRRIGDGDVVMTYASSHVVQRALLTAWTEGKRFSVVVVDSRPRLEAQALLSSLSELGVPCQYTLISCVSSVMPSVSCLLLGASAMLSNGALVSRCGTAVVSAIAHRLHVPVLVLCETYKFTDRVQLDAICNNELADPDELLRGSRGEGGGTLSAWRDVAGLKLLNLVYDVTPVDFVTMVVTEVGNVPATSVPVILREYHSEDAGDFE